MKKIVKIITYFDDSTFTECVPSQQEPMQSVPLNTNPNKCSKCNLDLRGGMGYYCSNISCPSGLGGSISMGLSYNERTK